VESIFDCKVNFFQIIIFQTTAQQIEYFIEENNLKIPQLKYDQTIFGKMLSGVRLDHIGCAVRKVSDGFRLMRRLRGSALKGKSLQNTELIC
jgi:hypothetical protein